MLTGLTTAFSLWFSLALYGYVSQHPINYFVSFVLLNLFILSAYPIYYEAIVECTYPVSEGKYIYTAFQIYRTWFTVEAYMIG